MKVNTTSIKLNKFTPMISLLLLCKNINLFLAFLPKKLHIITYKNNRTFFNMPKKISLFICLLSLLITGISSYKASCHFLNNTYFFDPPSLIQQTALSKKYPLLKMASKAFQKLRQDFTQPPAALLKKTANRYCMKKTAAKNFLWQALQR